MNIEIPLKRGPGRPKKIETEESQNTPKPKRGRPPKKSKLESQDGQSVPKKRGRKSKNAIGYCPLTVVDTVRMKSVIEDSTAMKTTTESLLKFKDLVGKDSGFIGFIPVFNSLEKAQTISEDVEEVNLGKGRLPILEIEV